MARTSKKVVVKNYDSQKVNGWELSYEYEAENGAAPTEVKVTGQKNAGSLYVSKSNGNTSVNFNNADVDGAVITVINTELALITAVAD